MPTSIRRSQRNAGKKIKGPTRYEHDLFVDPPVGSRRKKVGPKKVLEVEVLALTAPEDEDKSDAVLSKHPSKNYTKFNLYDRWVKARTDVSTYKQEVLELEKESVRDKKEIAKLYKELNKETEKVEKLQDKVDDLLLEVEEEKVK